VHCHVFFAFLHIVQNLPLGSQKAAMQPTLHNTFPSAALRSTTERLVEFEERLRAQERHFSEHRASVTGVLEAVRSRLDNVDFKLEGVLAGLRFQRVGDQMGNNLLKVGIKVESLSLRLTDVEAKLDGLLNRGELAPPLVPTSAHAELVEELSRQILTIETRVASNEHSAQLCRQSLEESTERLGSIERELKQIQDRMGKRSLDVQTCEGCDELVVNTRKIVPVPMSSRRRAVFMWLSYFDAFPRRPNADDIEHLVTNSRRMPPVHSWVSIAMTILAVCLLASLSVYPSMTRFVQAVPIHTTRIDTGRPITIGSTANMPYFWVEISPCRDPDSGLFIECRDDLVRVEVQQKNYLLNESYRNLTFGPGPCPRARDMRTGRKAFANTTFMCPIDDEDTGELSGTPGSQPHRAIIVRITKKSVGGMYTYVAFINVCWGGGFTVDFEGDLSNKFAQSPSADCAEFGNRGGAMERVYFQYNSATMNSRYNPIAGTRELSWASYFSRTSQPLLMVWDSDVRVLEFQLRPQMLLHKVLYFSMMDVLVSIGGSWGSWIAGIGMLNVVVHYSLLLIRGRLLGEDLFDNH